MENNYVVSIDFVNGKHQSVEGNEIDMYKLYHRIKSAIETDKRILSINSDGVESVIAVDKIAYVEIYNRDRYSSL